MGYAKVQKNALNVPLFGKDGISGDPKSILIIPSDTLHQRFFFISPAHLQT